MQGGILKRVLFLFVAGFISLILTKGSVYSQGKKTWKYVEELTKQEQEYWQIDPRWSEEVPRHKERPWYPAEPFPFEPPYTGEEISNLFFDRYTPGKVEGDQDVFQKMITSRGNLSQQELMAAKRRVPYGDKMYKLKDGDIEEQLHIIYYSPPAVLGLGTAWDTLSDSPNYFEENKVWVWVPTLRRVRRIFQGTEADAVLGSDLTYGDYVLQDVFEHRHKIIGIDIINNENLQKAPVLGEKIFSDIGPYVTPDGGVECYVVLSTPYPDNKDYYLSKWIIWYDKRYKKRIRIEQYDKEGYLYKIILWNWKKYSSPLLDIDDPRTMGYSGLYCWDMKIDHQSWFYSEWILDRLDEVFPDKEVTFTPESLAKEWRWKKPRKYPLLKGPEEWIPLPNLFPDKFPKYRKIMLRKDLEKRIEREAPGIFK